MKKINPMEHPDFVFSLISSRSNAAHFPTRESAQDFADGIRESTVWSADERGRAWAVRVGPWMYAYDIKPRVGAQPPPRKRPRINWTPDLVAKLGKETDLDIANELGCEKRTVAYRRAKFSIPATYEFSGALQWTPEMDDKVGLDFDYRIADRLGVSTDAVRKRRDQLGIPSVGPSKKKVA